MDVQLPDGTVVKDVPEGTTKAQLVEKLQRNGMNVPAEWAADGKPKSEATGWRALDAPNAVASGYNRGVLRLLGLPVDTVANVLDLGKAAIAVPYSMATGNAVPDWAVPADRSGVVGSGDYLIRQAQESAIGRAAVNPQNPEYEGGYLQATGAGLSSIMSPATKAQAVNQGLLGLGSSVASKATKDLTGNDALAITAGMAPRGLQQAVTAGVKRAVRGGEEGRKEMEQRIQDLQNAGVDKPTLGLASGNQMVGGLENLLQNAPGAVGLMRKARENAVSGLEAKSQRAAEVASPDRGSLAAGRGIQKGIEQFKENFKKQQEGLYNELGAKIGGQTPTNVDKTRSTLATLNEDIAGAPELSKFFKNAKIQALERAMESDVTGNRPATPSQLKSALANSTNVDEFNAQIANRSLPFEAVKKTRTLVGNELADHSLLSDVPKSKWRPLYGSLTDDMKAAAESSGPAATRAFNRANDYTRSGLDRLERVAPVADRKAPEQSFGALEKTLAENASIFQTVKKSLPEGVRGQVAGTVIEELGKAKAGVQNDAGSIWSPETFLTNWNRMSPTAKNELLSGFPNASQVRADVEAVAKATSMMRESSKMWANPSGTGANVASRATLGGLGLGAAGAAMGIVNPAVPLTAGGVLIGNHLLARGLTDEGLVKAFARPNTTNPQLTQAQINALVSTGLLNPDGYQYRDANRK
jgi:hypothetical protein